MLCYYNNLYFLFTYYILGDFMVDYLYLKDSLHTFRQNYNFLKIFSIGKSILNNEIYCIKFGIGKKEVLYTAGIHATEWITSLLLIKFAQNLCNAFVSNSQIYGYDAKYLYENCSLYIVPMINPDGINLVNNFYSTTSEVYISANNIAKNYPDIPFPSGWKANINGESLINFHHFIFKKQCSLYYISIVFASNVILPFQHSKFSLFQ